MKSFKLSFKILLASVVGTYLTLPMAHARFSCFDITSSETITVRHNPLYNRAQSEDANLDSLSSEIVHRNPLLEYRSSFENEGLAYKYYDKKEGNRLLKTATSAWNAIFPDKWHVGKNEKTIPVWIEQDVSDNTLSSLWESGDDWLSLSSSFSSWNSSDSDELYF